MNEQDFAALAQRAREQVIPSPAPDTWPQTRPNRPARWSVVVLGAAAAAALVGVMLWNAGQPGRTTPGRVPITNGATPSVTTGTVAAAVRGLDWVAYASADQAVAQWHSGLANESDTTYGVVLTRDGWQSSTPVTGLPIIDRYHPAVVASDGSVGLWEMTATSASIRLLAPSGTVTRVATPISATTTWAEIQRPAGTSDVLVQGDLGSIPNISPSDLFAIQGETAYPVPQGSQPIVRGYVARDGNGRIWAAGNDATGISWVEWTDDGGASWTAHQVSQAPGTVGGLVLGGDGRVGVIASQGGLTIDGSGPLTNVSVRSDDHGGTWRPWQAAGLPVGASPLAGSTSTYGAPSGRVFTVDLAQQQLMTASDAWDTFAPVSGIGPVTWVRGNGDLVWAGNDTTTNRTLGGRVYLSTDAGRTWTAEQVG